MQPSPLPGLLFGPRYTTYPRHCERQTKQEWHLQDVVPACWVVLRMMSLAAAKVPWVPRLQLLLPLLPLLRRPW